MGRGQEQETEATTATITGGMEIMLEVLEHADGRAFGHHGRGVVGIVVAGCPIDQEYPAIPTQTRWGGRDLKVAVP